MNLFEFVFTSIYESTMPLRNYQGQPILLVNTASKCDFTPQYLGLEKIWADYRHSGLVVIGMPCNDFGQQEPDSEADIEAFCRSQFNVSFPLTCKYHVMGMSAHPIFYALREEFGDDVSPRWNFYKYLFNGYGQLVDYWPSKVQPNDSALTHKIECSLQSWVL